MPNTKSAQRRARVSATRNTRNQSVKSRLHTLEKKFRTLVTTGKGAESGQALRATISALDKAAKQGAIPRRRADRKKSRLSARLNASQG